MFTIIENIGFAFIAAGVLTFVAYFIASMLKGGRPGVAHYAGMVVLFMLLSYQSYRLLDAWDEKNAIEDVLEGLNSWTDNAIDFIDEVDRQSGGNGHTGEQIRNVMSNPLIKQGVKLFGVDVGVDGQMTVEMGERLKSEYNWYMFRRVCWMLGLMIAYLIIAMFLPTTNPSSGYRTRPTERNSHQSSRIQRHSSRRR